MKSTEQLHSRLREMETRWKKIRFWRAAGLTFVLLIFGLSLGALVDYLFPLAIGHRRWMTLAIYGGVALFAFLKWWCPYKRSMPAEEIAWALEEKVPELDEKLISAVEFSGEQSEKISGEMIEHVLQDAELDLGKIEPERVFPITWKILLWPALVAFLFLAAFFVPSLHFGKLITRVAFPSARQATVGSFALLREAPSIKHIAEGDHVDFSFRCTDPSIETVEFCIQSEKVRRYPMDKNPETGYFHFNLAEGGDPFQYWAQSGRVQSTTYGMDVMATPRVEQFQIAYDFPEYTRIEDSAASSTEGDLKAIEGTRATVQFQFNKPMKSVQLKLKTNGVSSSQIPLKLSAAASDSTHAFELVASGTYELILEDKNGLANRSELIYSIDVVPDLPPIVSLELPVNDVHLGPEDSLPIQWSVEDDFGVIAQSVVYSTDGKTEGSVKVPRDATEFRWNLKQENFGKSAEVVYRIKATDQHGNEGVSKPMVLSLVKNHFLTKAPAFQEAARLTRDIGKDVTGRMGPISSLAEKVRDGLNGADAEDREHNLTLLKTERLELQARLSDGEAASRSMSQNSFFPKAREASDLVNRYFRQERMFASVHVGEDKLSINALREMGTLNGAMARALLAKADQQVPYIQLREMQRSIKNIKDMSLLERTARRAKVIAESFIPEQAGQFDDASEVAIRLPVLIEKMKGKAENYQEIERIATQIREKLNENADRLQNLAQQLDLYDRDEDWAAVEALKSSLEEAAAQSDSPAEQADLQLAADVLQRALNEKDAYLVEAVTDQLPSLESLHSLVALDDELSQAQADTKALKASEELEDVDLNNLANLVEEIREDPMVDDAPNDYLMKQFEEQMKQAEQQVGAAENALHKEDVEQAKQQLAQADQSMEKAQTVMDKMLPEAEQESDRARAALEALIDSPAQQLAEIEAMAQKALAAKEPAEGEAPLARDEQTKQEQALSDQLAEVAKSLQENAAQELADKDGNIQQARNEMALAASIEDLAETPLEEALAELAKAKETAKQLEAAKNSELSSSDKSALQAMLDDLATEHLDPKLQDTLNLLEHMRESSEQADLLAQRSEESKGQKSKQEQVAEEAEELRKKLTESLLMRDPDAFMDETKQVIQDALEDTEELLTDARALRAKMRDPQNLSEDQLVEARDLAERAEALGQDLAQVDAAQQMLGMQKDPAAQPVLDTAEPQLRDTAKRMEEGNNASENLSKAIEGIKKADARLQEIADDLATHELPIFQPEPFDSAKERREAQIEKRMDFDQIAHAMDRIENALTDAVATKDGEEQLGDEIAPTRRETANLLAELQAETLDPAVQNQIQEAQRQLDHPRNPLHKTAEKLQQLADKFDQGEAKDQLQEQAKKLYELNNKKGHPLEQLRQRAEQHAKDLETEARKLETQLANRDDELAESAREAVVSMANQVANENFETAERNFDALKKDIQAMLKPASTKPDRAKAEEEVQPHDSLSAKAKGDDSDPVTTEEIAKSNPEFTQAANEKLDMQTRKGLMEAAAQAMREPEQTGSEQAAEMAAEGKLEAAADIAPLPAAEPLQKAAELASRQEADPKPNPLDSNPENPRMDNSRASQIAKAQENLSSAQNTAEELREALEQNQVPSEEAVARLDEHVADAESMRAALGETEHPANQHMQEDVLVPLNQSKPDLLNTEKGLKDLAETLAEYEKNLREQAKQQERFDTLSEMASDMKTVAATSADEAKKIAQSIEDFLGEQVSSGNGTEAEAAAMDALNQVAKTKDASAVEKQANRAAEEIAKLDPALDATRKNETPEAFQNPRATLSPNAEKSLAKQAAEDPSGLIKEAQEAVAEAQKQHDALSNQLAGQRAGKKAPTPKALDALQDAIKEAEAMREYLGATDFDAKQALDKTKTDPATAVQELGDILAEYEQELEQAAKAQAKSDKVEALSEQIAAAGEHAKAKTKAKAKVKAAKAAKELAASLATENGLASQEAAKAADAYSEAIKKQDASAAEDAAEALSQAKQALDPQTQSNRLTSEEAFDATARAEALENQDATAKAQAGDFEAASESMQALADALPPGKNKSQAEQAAKEFQAAREAQMEALPKSLQDKLEHAEKLEDELKGTAAKALKYAADSVRAGDLAKASEQLQPAIQAATPQQKPSLEAFDQALKQTAAAEKSKQNARPDEVKELAKAIASLAEGGDPVTAQPLQKAMQELEQENFQEAAEQVSKAAFALPEQDFQPASELAETLQAKDAERYGDMSDTARKAVQAMQPLSPPSPSSPSSPPSPSSPDEVANASATSAQSTPSAQAVEAAKALDYLEAAEQANKANEKEASDLFRQAAQEQLAALPMVVQEGIQNLAKAQREAPTTVQRDQLEEAIKAARRGDLNEAQAIAREASQSGQQAAELAKALEEAETDMGANAIKPLEKALELAKRNQFGKAASEAMQSPFGQEAAEKLAASEDKLQGARATALDDAFAMDPSNEKEKLKQSADAARSDNLDDAIRKAAEAGKTGDAAEAAYRDTKMDGQQSTKALEQALSAAKNNQDKKQMQQAAIQAAQEIVKDRDQAARASQAAEQQSRALQQARQELNQNKPKQAAQTLARTKAEALNELTEQLNALEDTPSNEAKQALNQALAKALSDSQQAARDMDRLKTEAQQAEREMRNAAQDAAEGKFAQASEHAKAAAGGAVEAMQAAENFAEAIQQQNAKPPSSLSDANALASNSAAPSSSPEASSSSDSESGSDSSETGSEAPQTAQANPSDADQASTSPSGKSPSSSPSFNDNTPSSEMAQAMMDLQQAQADLTQGASDAPEHLHEASDALSKAAESLTQQALAQMAEQMSSGSGEQTASSQPPSSPSSEQQASSQNAPSSPSESGQNESSEPSSAASGGDQASDNAQGGPGGDAADDMTAMTLGDTWKGVEKGLTNRDKQGKKNQYSDYYRKANQSYLEQLIKEKKR